MLPKEHGRYLSLAVGSSDGGLSPTHECFDRNGDYPSVGNVRCNSVCGAPWRHITWTPYADLIPETGPCLLRGDNPSMPQQS
eukprot:3901184-Pyramimonas_sp.AAC.1